MSASQAQPSQFPERTNGQRFIHVLGQTQHLADPSKSTLTDQTASSGYHGGVPYQDPFTYYKAFLSTESPSAVGLQSNSSQLDDGYTGSRLRSEGQFTGEQQQAKPRAVPYNLAVRLANRSNGAPLATIIEQGSVSTLNSHGSLLSVGRFPSIRAVENVSPGRASHRASRSLDDNALKRIQEEDQHEHESSHKPSSLGVQSDLGSHQKKATVTASGTSDDQNGEIPQLPEIDLDLGTRSFKTFFRGVLTNVRSSRRARSRSSSSTIPPTLSASRRWSGPFISPSSEIVQGKLEAYDSQGSMCPESAATSLLYSTSSLPNRAPEAPDCSNPSVKADSSACVRAPKLHLSPLTVESRTELSSAPTLPPLTDLSRPQNGKEPLPSVYPMVPEPCDAALDHVRHAATTFLSRSRDELSARYTPDGAIAHRNDDGSLREYARNPSRNASFCSTMSTSYSGTVLGIDLDLQHEFPHASRRSVTPVWFSPMDNVVKAQDPLKREVKLEEAKPLRPRSITSSALPSLLPIAAAEGIVQQNLTTPQLSFFSPSGNLIQAQDSSSTPTPASSFRSRSDSFFSGTPAISTSYYNNNNNLPSAQSALSAAATLPPARPALAPLTTPPQSSAPLPEHLRHHHNYQHAEKSRIRSMSDSDPTLPSDVVLTSDSKVRGCGGVVRPTSLNPHSGVPKSPQKMSRIGHSMSCIHMSEASRARLGFLPSWPTVTKGRTLKKRNRPPRIEKVTEGGGVGPVAGHALRVCFCQPYDGAGKQSAEARCGGGGAGQQGHQQRQCQSEACARGPHEAGTPNARLVGSRDGDGDAGDKRKGKGRGRSDSAVSVGIRVGLVGG